MIHIDFQGGAHGNYLEFVCNRIAGVVEPGTLPFNGLGAAHDQMYCAEPVFFSGHYSFLPNQHRKFKRIISIRIEPDDLLPLSQISLLRAGDYGYDNDQLEINTFNKLNNENYRWVLDALINGFFANQTRDSYNAVRDPSWPDVNNLDDFHQLPPHIRAECIQQHGLVLVELSEKRPDCPRRLLREFFKIGFQNPSQHGFITQQQKAQYNTDDDVYVFPFGCFYEHELFLSQIQKIAAWAGIPYECEHEIVEIHQAFLARQPYKDSKNKCDRLLQNIASGDHGSPVTVTMLEEAYINAVLDRDYYQ
jgi:hypothetical protein